MGALTRQTAWLVWAVPVGHTHAYLIDAWGEQFDQLEVFARPDHFLPLLPAVKGPLYLHTVSTPRP